MGKWLLLPDGREMIASVGKFTLPQRIMKESDKVNRESRAAEKRVSRQADALRLEQGEDPAVLQHENSIFPKDFFKDARISNLKKAIGR